MRLIPEGIGVWVQQHSGLLCWLTGVHEETQCAQRLVEHGLEWRGKAGGAVEAAGAPFHF